MERKPRPPKNDLTGKQFGYLTVLKMVQTEKSVRGQYRVLCRCDNCGNENFETSASAVMQGRTKSCGCDKSRYDKTRGKNSVLFTGYEEIGGKLWGTIKRRASRRGYKVEVDLEYVWDLYLCQDRKCALSGLPISFGISNGKTSDTTASLDRIDSSKGYVEGNVQWVHKALNIMKNVIDNTVFVNLCRKVAATNTNAPIMSDDELSNNHFKE